MTFDLYPSGIETDHATAMGGLAKTRTAMVVRTSHPSNRGKANFDLDRGWPAVGLAQILNWHSRR
jgi:hypothetical protein